MIGCFFAHKIGATIRKKRKIKLNQSKEKTQSEEKHKSKLGIAKKKPA